jgi:hypothetical protein
MTLGYTDDHLYEESGEDSLVLDDYQDGGQAYSARDYSVRLAPNTAEDILNH